MPKIRIVVADDHAILRAGLRLLINAQPDMEVVAEVSGSTGVVHQTQESRPDVVVLDFSLPGRDTCEVIETIRRQSPRTQVLVMSMYDDSTYLTGAMTAGASGFVLKRSGDTELLSAIRAVHRGDSFLDPNLAADVLRKTVQKMAGAQAGHPHKARTPLTGRQRDVLVLVSQGYTNRQVAERLLLNVKTVETHRARIMRKLGFTSRVDLIRYGRETLVHDTYSSC